MSNTASIPNGKRKKLLDEALEKDIEEVILDLEVAQSKNKG